MSQVTYPGVYIREIPSGARTITGVATSITVFIGRTKKGVCNEPITIHSYADFERQFGGLWSSSLMPYAVSDFYLNGGSQAIIVRLHKSAEKAKLNLKDSGGKTLELQAASEGSWGNSLKTTVDHNTKDPADDKLFNLTIEDTNSGARETFINISVDTGSARFAGTILEQQSQLVHVVKAGDTWKVSTKQPKAEEATATASSGKDGDPITKDQFTGVGLEDKKEGLYSLEKAELFNIVCIPPYKEDESVDKELVGTVGSYCEKHRAFYVVDSPPSWTSKKNAIDGLSDLGTMSKNAAVFFPRISKSDPLMDNQLRNFASCGTVAGIMSRTDAQTGVWKAAAGQDASIIGASGLSVPLTDAENGELNPIGINCLRNMPAMGRVVWGARTLQGNDALASEWKYIPIRRLALFLEETLFRSTHWVVFEPNDEPLWSQIRLSIGSFMHSLFLQGAFQGKTPNEAYFVKCDSETTTQNDIDLGIVNISVGFAPLKPAEFVVISLQQMAGQSAL